MVGTTHYTLEFDATADWTNTLMGWNGVADTMDQLRNRFRFETPAEAIYFCETNGACWPQLAWGMQLAFLLTAAQARAMS